MSPCKMYKKIRGRMNCSACSKGKPIMSNPSQVLLGSSIRLVMIFVLRTWGDGLNVLEILQIKQVPIS